MFSFFNDPEGPNVLIVVGMAAVVYVVSLAAYFFYPSAKLTGLKKVLLAIFVQALVVSGLSFYLS
jgi:hypothetical protein